MDTTSAVRRDSAARPLSASRDAALDEVPFPRYLIALVQDESEMLLQPAYDLFAFLDDDSHQRWDVELYTERTFEAMLRADTQFDCIVLGLNAAYRSKVIRDALAGRLPRTGLCLLHQFGEQSMSFMVGDVGVGVSRLEHAPVRRVVTAEKLPVKDEILLNWPTEIGLERDPAPAPAASGRDGAEAEEPVQRLVGGEAFRGLVPGPASRWRTVLEIDDGGRRVPVLLRTPSDRSGSPVVVCSVLLRPREKPHISLLGNILSYCVGGRPEALVAGDARTADDARLVHRKLRMQGVKAVATRVTSDAPVDFECWPYRGIRDVVLPATLDPTAKAGWPDDADDDPTHAREWLQGGGRISRLEPTARLTVTHRESDAHWVTRDWASWFLAEPAAVWHGGVAHGVPHDGSLIATRAVLRFLAAVHGDQGPGGRRQPGLLAAESVRGSLARDGAAIDPGRFGLRRIEVYLEPIEALLRKYVDESSPALHSRDRRYGTPTRHIHYSVSTTCALLDVNALMGGPLDGRTTAPFKAWLERQSRDAALDDRLEIARCLGDGDLLEETLGLVSSRVASTRPLTASLETKLREAIVACDVAVKDVPEMDPGAAADSRDRRRERETVVERALRTSPLLCANYLVALGDLRVHWELEADAHEASFATPDPRAVDRAVIGIGRHGALDSTGGADDGPHEMRSTKSLALLAYFGRHPVPTHVIRRPGAGAGQLPPDLMASVLKESERLRRENAIVVAQARTIELARHALGGLTLAASLLVVALAWVVTGDGLELPVIGTLGNLVLLALLFGGGMVLLGRRELSPRWGPQLVLLFADGFDGLKARVKRNLPGQDTTPPSEAT